MARRFSALAFLVLFGAVGACSSEDEGQTSNPGTGKPDSGGGSGGTSGSAGTGGAGSGGGGAGGTAGMSGSAGTGGAAGTNGASGAAGSSGASGSGGSVDAGGGQDAGACRTSAACGSGQRCCVTMRIANNALESSSSMCTASCAPRAGSTGSGALITSIGCAARSDCSGVRNESGVAYNQCCSMPGSSTGVCVSETHAFSTFEPAGGTCL